jgi:hypothetical protein
MTGARERLAIRSANSDLPDLTAPVTNVRFFTFLQDRLNDYSVVVANEINQSFMAGYVRRINDATLRVAIGGVRIGNARYSRLAQINLRTRIITFSRYAIQNVPERGRRYLVIHELAHVLEPSHNKRFWAIVAQYEPNYKEVDKELTAIFNANVRAAEQAGDMRLGEIRYLSDGFGDTNCDSEILDGSEDETGAWSTATAGIVCGGSS